MAFLKDKSDGDIGENIALEVLAQLYPDRKFLKSEAKTVKHDIFEVGVEDYHRLAREEEALTIEVKYDLMARKTGNLCFEIGNVTKKDGAKKTGIAATESKEVWYVTGTPDDYVVIRFNTVTLLQYLLYSLVTTKNVKVVNGGDQNRFTLLLVKAKSIIENTELCTVIRKNKD